MARRKDPATPGRPGATQSSATAVEERVVAFAEQLGRVVGTIQNKTDGWMADGALQDQLTTIRDGAADLLNDLTDRAKKAASGFNSARTAQTAPRRTAPAGRSGGKVDAPGKKHRKPPASVRGARHSDETISKLKSAQAVRRGPRRG